MQLLLSCTQLPSVLLKLLELIWNWWRTHWCLVPQTSPLLLGTRQIWWSMVQEDTRYDFVVSWLIYRGVQIALISTFQPWIVGTQYKIQTIDYLKCGTPLQLTLWLTSTWVLSTTLPWYVTLGITSLILAVVYVLRFWREALMNRFKKGGKKPGNDK